MNIEEDNKLIAEFLGWEHKNLEPGTGILTGWYIDDRLYHPPNCGELRFHKSWDWLMPVILKIQEISAEQHDEFFISFTDEHGKPMTWVSINRNMWFSNKDPLLAIYQTVVAFIKIYNSKLR